MAKRPLLEVLVHRYASRYDRDRLSAFVACRNVVVNGELIADPRRPIPEDATIVFSFDTYVSRGGYKIEHALSAFDISVKDLTMLDAGSSTGGFTDCLLQRGAKLVHAVDVGYNQLDWKIRTDSRVVVHERQNIMTLEYLDPPCDAAVCDLSFRSISGAASHILSLVGDSWLVALIKPQFELPKGQERFSGVITDMAMLTDAMGRVHRLLADDGVGIMRLTRSPITGHKGNIEFLALLQKREGMDASTYLGEVDALLRT